MIKAIRIRGFQSHIDTEAFFSPHLTVITGATDSGKTAILRAIRWIAFGEPGGAAFINNTIGEAMVEITMDNDVLVQKTRKGNKTEYQVVDADGERLQTWESAAVPPEVTAALGLVKQTFGDVDATINFAYQLDAPFLISLPASAGAKVLGKIAGTEVVDLAVKDVAKETYAARQEIAQAERAIEKIDAQLGKYADLETIRETVKSCADLLARYDADQARKEKLERGKLEAETNRQNIKAHERRLRDFIGLHAAENALAQAEAAQKQVAACKNLRDRHEACTQTIRQKQQILLQLNNLELANQSIEGIEAAIGRLDTMQCLKRALAKLQEKISTAQSVLDKTIGLATPDKLVHAILEQAERIQSLQEMQLKQQRLAKYIAERESVLAVTENCETAYVSLLQIEENEKRLIALNGLRTLAAFREQQLTAGILQDQAAAETLAAKKKELDLLWAELDVCPLCEQPIMKGDGKLGCKNAH